MRNITVTVEADRAASAPKGTVVITDNSDYIVVFNIADGSGFDTTQSMTAIFVTRRGEQQVDFSGGQCSVPILISKDGGELQIGITQGTIRTTTDARVKIRKSIKSFAGSAASPVSPDAGQIVDDVAADDIISVNDVSAGSWVRASVATIAARIKAIIGTFTKAASGLVPAPGTEASDDAVLHADGTWSEVEGGGAEYFDITLSYSGNTISADRTHTEIATAYAAGKILRLITDNALWPCIFKNASGWFIFGGIPNDAPSVVFMEYYELSPYNRWSHYRTSLQDQHLVFSLTIKGGDAEDPESPGDWYFASGGPYAGYYICEKEIPAWSAIGLEASILLQHSISNIRFQHAEATMGYITFISGTLPEQDDAVTGIVLPTPTGSTVFYDITEYADAAPISGSSAPVSSGGVYTALQGKQNTSALVTSLSAQSTDTQYPSAKCVYNAIDAAITDAIEEAY